MIVQSIRPVECQEEAHVDIDSSPRRDDDAQYLPTESNTRSDGVIDR